MCECSIVNVTEDIANECIDEPTQGVQAENALARLTVEDRTRFPSAFALGFAAVYLGIASYSEAFETKSVEENTPTESARTTVKRRGGFRTRRQEYRHSL